MLRKKLLLIYLLLLATLVVIIGCDNMSKKYKEETLKEKDTFDLESARAAIENKNIIFAKSMVNGDTIALLNHYTDDARIFPSNAAIVNGKKEISKLFSELSKMKMGEFKVETTLLYGNPENLIEEGQFIIGDGKGTTFDKGKYICIWRKVGGEWKCYSDIWNSDRPLTTSP